MNWAEAWKTDRPNPKHLRLLRSIKWDDFEASVIKGDEEFIKMLVGSLISGDAWILKGAFSLEFIKEMKERCLTWCASRPESFHQILDGVPDFHRAVTFELSKKYSTRHCRQSAYFFRWNGDPLNIWTEVTRKWRVVKIALGMGETRFESNFPRDGMTDRLQIARYLPGIGYLEPHRDPFAAQPCFISGYMSKRGVDYQGGGFYFVDENNKPVFAEDNIDAGDMCIGHANLLHGVAPCDGAPDWKGSDGRWFLGLYSVPSDYSRERDTTKPEQIVVEGVIPEGA